MRPPNAALRAGVTLAVCLAAGAARAGGPRCTIPDAKDWMEYRSAHFVLSTDVSRGRAAELVEQLERLHALVVAALFGEQVEVPGRVNVVAFSSPRRFDDFAPERAGAYVNHGPRGTTVVFPFEGLEPAAETVAHELAHAVSFHHFPRQPSWFAEGLAGFLMSVAVVRRDDAAPVSGSHIVRGDRRTGGRWAGYASPRALELVKFSTAVGAKELLAWRGRTDEGDPARFHAASWLLYHWLWNKRSGPFSEYQRRLAAGDDPAAAWRATFPEFDPASDDAMASLDRELAAYRRAASYLPYPVEPGPVDGKFEDSAIAPADLHVLLLGIRSRWPASKDGRDAIVRAETDEALREDPYQPESLASRARLGGTSVAAAVRPATVARPGDPRAWLALARALDAKTDAQEKEAALRKAVALAPDDAEANNALAWLLVSSGRAREARRYAEHALDLAPWSPDVVDTLAAVAFGLGQCKAAVILQRRAADGYQGDDPVSQGVRGRVAAYEAKCGASPAAPEGKPAP